MAAPPNLPALAAQVADLTDKVAVLQTWADSIVALAASREKRIADLEAYVRRNDDRIGELDRSDVASGWAQWRHDQTGEGS